jgi:hypothetical protein
MLSKNLKALVAASMIFGSSAAVAQSAQSLSVAHSPAVSRAAASTEDANQLYGTTIYIVGAIVIGLAIWGIIELTDDNNDNPSSP